MEQRSARFRGQDVGVIRQLPLLRPAERIDAQFAERLGLIPIGPNLAEFITSFDIALTQNNKQKAPVDYGYGPGLGIGSPRPNLVLGRTPAKAALAKLAVPNGGDHYQGYFAPPVPWPFIPIHMALLPDGRVMTFGRAANLARQHQWNDGLTQCAC